MTQPLRSAALGEQLADLLRSRIVRADLAAGTHLVEDGLASAHDVSRGPVRDALRILTAEGLLESRRRGYFVKGFTVGDVEELYQIREAMEQLACRLAVQNAGHGHWTRAEGFVDAMRQSADRQDWHDFAVADLAFHSEFYDLAGNARLSALWRQYRPTFTALLDVTNAQDADLHPSAEDHAFLLRLAMDRDEQKLGETVAQHLAGSAQRMRQALAQPSTGLTRSGDGRSG